MPSVFFLPSKLNALSRIRPSAALRFRPAELAS